MSKKNINVALETWKQRLHPEDYNQLRQTFNYFDQDGSGTIDPVEIYKILQELGTSGRNPLALAIIKKCKDVSKSITFDQFVDIVGSLIGQTRTKDGMKRVFKLIDQNQDGCVDFFQFKKWLKMVGQHMNDQDILQMMHSVHINRKTSTNETLTFDEFYRIVSKLKI